MTARIEKIEAHAYKIPTDRPESDGTFTWNATTIAIAFVHAAGKKGIGYSYTSAGAVPVIRDELAPRIEGADAFETGRCWMILKNAVRNLGRAGIAKMAAAAVIAAIWDLKGKLLDLSLAAMLGACRNGIPVYGSGGFTSYTLEELAAQMGGWANEGIKMVKMKIGRDPNADPERIHTVRDAVGPGVQVFVDANEAFDRKTALAIVDDLVHDKVTWYEQPIHHLDFDGMRLIRDRLPASIELTSGEYGFEPDYFRRMMEAGAVDIIQADATRCGVNDFLAAANLCSAYHLPISSHTAPALHAHLCCVAETARNLEYFYDHVRIEQMLFDGVPVPRKGIIEPDLGRPGLGIVLKEKDAEQFLIT